MLLAGLQGKYKCTAALLVTGLAHYAAGQFAHMFLGTGHEAHIRTAIAQGYSQWLAVTYSDIGTPLYRCL